MTRQGRTSGTNPDAEARLRRRPEQKTLKPNTPRAGGPGRQAPRVCGEVRGQRPAPAQRARAGRAHERRRGGPPRAPARARHAPRDDQPLVLWRVDPAAGAPYLASPSNGNGVLAILRQQGMRMRAPHYFVSSIQHCTRETIKVCCSPPPQSMRLPRSLAAPGDCGRTGDKQWKYGLSGCSRVLQRPRGMLLGAATEVSNSADVVCCPLLCTAVPHGP